MRFVVDANVLFALAKPSSAANEIFSEHKPTLLAPDFALIELYKYKQVLSEKSGQSFTTVIESLRKKVVFTDKSEYKQFIKHALSLLPDPKDAAYLALALKLELPIWSNDSHLKKQSRIGVFTTEEVTRLLAK